MSIAGRGEIRVGKRKERRMVENWKLEGSRCAGSERASEMLEGCEGTVSVEFHAFFFSSVAGDKGGDMQWYDTSDTEPRGMFEKRQALLT